MDAPLPLISNVVSLSQTAADELESFAAAAAADDNGDDATADTAPSNNNSNSRNSNNSSSSSNNNNSGRTATLRLKRGIEISFQVDQNGQPVTVAVPGPAGSEVGASSAAFAGHVDSPNAR